MRTKARRFFFEAARGCFVSRTPLFQAVALALCVGLHDIVDADERNDYLAFPGFVRTAPSSATWTANRLAGSLALAFSLTK